MDITDPYRPREAGALVPPAPDRIIDPRPGRRPKSVQTADVFATAEGIVYATDYNGGLTVAEPPAKGRLWLGFFKSIIPNGPLVPLQRKRAMR